MDIHALHKVEALLLCEQQILQQVPMWIAATWKSQFHRDFSIKQPFLTHLIHHPMYYFTLLLHSHFWNAHGNFSHICLFRPFPLQPSAAPAKKISPKQQKQLLFGTFEYKNGGEGGIRTPGRLLYLRRFSKPLPSATQPPLRLYGISLNCQNIFNMPHVSNKANLFPLFS